MTSDPKYYKYYKAKSIFWFVVSRWTIELSKFCLANLESQHIILRDEKCTKTTHEWKWMFEKNVKCSQIIGFQVGEPLKNNYNDVDTMAIIFYIVFHFMKCFINK